MTLWLGARARRLRLLRPLPQRQLYNFLDGQAFPRRESLRQIDCGLILNIERHRQPRRMFD